MRRRAVRESQYALRNAGEALMFTRDGLARHGLGGMDDRIATLVGRYAVARTGICRGRSWR